jgi:hypothetical protein
VGCILNATTQPKILIKSILTIAIIITYILRVNNAAIFFIIICYPNFTLCDLFVLHMIITSHPLLLDLLLWSLQLL